MSKHPAILYPFVSRQPNKSLDEFNKWYDEVHAPSRKRCPGVIQVSRWSATDDAKPEWLAMYELDDVSAVHSPEYMAVRKNDGDDESVMFETLDRRVYVQISDRKRDDYESFCASGKPRDMLHVALQPASPDDELDFNSWYEHEHIDLLAKCPGWLRSTRWELVDARDPRTTPFTAENPEGNQKGLAKYLAFHEWENGEDAYASEEFRRATNTDWRTKVFEKVDEKLTERRKFKLWRQF